MVGSRCGALSAGRPRTSPVGQGFVRAGPKGLPHGPCTGEPASRVLTFHSGINAAALAYFRASYSFEKQNKTKK